MPTTKNDKEKANWRRRKCRRPDAIDDFDKVIRHKECPTFAELRDALRGAKESSEGILRMAALMDNLAAYHAPRFECDGIRMEIEFTKFRGRTMGIRKFLEQDGYLRSRYSTLMRYRRLAEHIREHLALTWEDVNLLWGFESDCPEDLDWAVELDCLEDTPYPALRKLYASLEGLNFKEIEQKLCS